ncbi:MAG TPA: TonB-dependent receptor [Gemmatimonadales bacterium]|nr:TonB-dependent receptor [Gemmatimonadales bacterium]
MRGLARLLAVGILALTALATPRRGEAQAQALALADRGPRFFLASTRAGAPPVEVEATRAALLRQEVSLTLDAPTVGGLLREIERQAGVKFFYGDDVLSPNRPVALRAERITLATALVGILMDAGVDVLLTGGNHLTLVRKPPAPVPAVGAIVGRVIDARNQTALVGATVIVDGTRHSATTGANGRYRIADVAPGTYTVRARFVGYAPGSVSVVVGADQEATADFGLERSTQRLEEVVTTGSVVETEVKALPTPISVITAEDIQRLGVQRVDQLFRGTVPGVSAMDDNTANYFTSVNVRGRSNFSTAAIKTFVDGVEIANESFITTIDPSSIERIEIIRGPQASTVYGSGANGGVMQIFTKKGASARQRPTLEGSVSGGVQQGQYADDGFGAHQRHSLQLSGRGQDFSYNIGGTYQTTGAWVPHYFNRDYSIYGGFHAEQGPVQFDGSVRHYSKRWNAEMSPILQQFADVVPRYGVYSNEVNDLRQQTLGLKLGVAATRWWKHQLTFGYDRNMYEYYQERPRLSTPADTLMEVSSVPVGKTSIGYNTTVSVPLSAAITSELTAGVDHDILEQSGFYVDGAPQVVGPISGSYVSPSRDKYGTSGYFAQFQVGVVDQFFLTGGLRAEQSKEGMGKDIGLAWAPRVGASWARTFGEVGLKVRAAYGKALLLPSPGYNRESKGPGYHILTNPLLGPEEQEGTDAGVELDWGRRAHLGVTVYDQNAINLIDLVVQQPDPLETVYQAQNVGRIKNRGVEVEAAFHAGPVSLEGTFTKVSSKVRTLGPNYTGDLQAGDEMLGVPRTVVGARVTYQLPRGSASFGLSYLGDWTQVDYLALYLSDWYFGTEPYRGSMRAYWREYPGVTRASLAFNHEVTKHFTGFLQVENLFNNYRAEGHTLNIAKGRFSVVGLRFRY